MNADEQTGNSGEETVSEDQNSGTEAPEDAAPALNRAQRRAMAHGKKGAGGGNSALPNNRQGGFQGNSAAKGGQSRFPRTGHK